MMCFLYVLLFNHQALLAGLCVSCPEDPLHFIEEKILEILENRDLEIYWFVGLGICFDIGIKHV